MAVVDIQSELAARNPSRTRDQIARSLSKIDENISLLALAKNSAGMAEVVDDELVLGLELIHRRLRRECDRLFQLL